MLRPYLNGVHNSGVTSLTTDGWPASALVILANSKITFESDSTNYTVQSDVNSDASGNATITILPGLSSQKADNAAILVPDPRTLTTAMRAGVAAENATLLYFMQFNFVLVKKITSIVDGGAGTILITSAAHGQSNGTQITLYATTNYNAVYTISNVTTNTFKAPATYVADETKGGFSVDKTTYMCTAPHDVPWDSKTWQGIGGNVGFEAITETTDLKGNGITQILSGVEQSIVSAILTYTCHGRYAKTWLAHIDSNGAIMEGPKRIFWGRMNGGFEVDEVREEGKPGTVTIRGRFVNRIGDLQLIRGIQSNEESHQRFFDGDEFFKDVASMMNKKITWGQQSRGG